MGIGVDWEKADIYSLAKTIVYIILGKVIESSECLADVEEIEDELKIILMEMLDENPVNRPGLKELLEILKN